MFCQNMKDYVWDTSMWYLFDFITDVKQNYDHDDDYCSKYLGDYTDGDVDVGVDIEFDDLWNTYLSFCVI